MKTNPYSLLIVLAMLACVPAVPAQPTLGIAPSGGQSVLYWPNDTTNYIVQSTTNLTSPNWVYANDAVPVNAVTVSNTLPARLFRLFAVPAGMALIPAGSFTIGNSIGDSQITDANPTNVYVSAFYMDVNLVSYGLWTNVYAYATANGYFFDWPGQGKNNATNQPIQRVDWYDCVRWCNARSAQAGLTPVYYTDAGLTQVYTNVATDAVYVNWAANGYRLPTEAEWEKAARGGLTGQRFPWGNLIGQSQANYYGNTNNYSYDLGPNGDNAIGSIGTIGGLPHTSPVGSFPPNGYGLYDMAGNVFERCWDWYAAPNPNYPSGSPYLGGTDPRGPASSPDGSRVLRGGSDGTEAVLAECAFRYSADPDNAADYIGFRCVRGL